MVRQRVVSAVVGLAVLGGIVVLNQVVVRALFDADYLDLYLQYGALANLAVVLILLAWSDEVERLTGLISAHPPEYVASYAMLGSGMLDGWGSSLAGGRAQYARELDAVYDLRAEQAEAPARMAPHQQQLRELAAADPSGMAARGLALSDRVVEQAEEAKKTRDPLHIPLGLGFADRLLSLVVGAVLALAFVAWLLLVVPVQYFVYLVAGAPARQAVGSPLRAWVRAEGKAIEVGPEYKLRELPDHAKESGYSAKPVTFTSSLAAVLVFVLDRVVG
jgi:hypothetical protein